MTVSSRSTARRYNGLLAAAGARAAAHSPTARKAVDGAARLLGTTTRAKSLSAADVASIGRALEESSKMAAAHEASRAEAEVERLRGEKEKAQSDAEVAQSHANVARQQLSMELRVLDAEERERRAEEAEEEEARLTARLAELEVAKQRQEAELEELKAAAEVQRRASDDSMSGLQRRASEGLEAVAARAELAESQFNAARRLQREELEIMEEEKRAAWEEEAERVIERARRQSEAEMDEARAKAAAELAAAKQEAEELRRRAVEDAESAAAAVAAAAATAAAGGGTGRAGGGESAANAAEAVARRAMHEGESVVGRDFAERAAERIIAAHNYTSTHPRRFALRSGRATLSLRSDAVARRRHRRRSRRPWTPSPR